MNNSQVAHIWANQSRKEAIGSHFYFAGDTVWSYSTPIARLYRGAVLLVRNQYSNSTARHKSEVSSAASHLPIFAVVNPENDPCKSDVEAYKDDVKAAKERLAKARNKHDALFMLQNTVATGNAFCERFGFNTRFSMPSEIELAALREQIAKDKIKRAKREAAREARELAAASEAIAEWRDGKIDRFSYSLPVCLRVNGESLETSKGASVPLSEAKRAFRFCMAVREKGWHRNGQRFPVGEFQLDAVNSQGVVAGCHRIAWPEIESFAKSQGWKA